MKSIPATDRTDITLLHILNKQPDTKIQEALMFCVCFLCVHSEKRLTESKRETSCSLIFVMSTEECDIFVNDSQCWIFIPGKKKKKVTLIWHLLCVILTESPEGKRLPYVCLMHHS